MAQSVNRSLVRFQHPVVNRFQVSLNVGQGRSQFMSDVGNQVAPLLFGSLQILGHSVESMAQVFNFAGAGGGNSLGQVTLTQPAGGETQGLYRSQDAAGH